MAISPQTYWVVKMITKYREITGLPACDDRRLFYWVESLPKSETMIPGRSIRGKGKNKKGEVRPFRLDQDDYKNVICKGLTEARIEGLIPWDWVTDGKNLEIDPAPEEIKGDITINSIIPNIDVPNIDEIESLPNFNNTINSIFFSRVIAPQFSHQEYHLVVFIEKATAIERLKQIKNKYGADLAVFRGRASVTRINDVIKNARKKGKPIALFYLSDCDIAGWNMPKSTFSRINQIYPGNNILIKVALTRAQIKRYDLHTAFEAGDKDYDECQQEEFIIESGSADCVEIDALREDIMIQILEDELSKYAGLEEDEKESKQLYNVEITTDHIEHIRDDYENLKNIYNSVTEKINKFYLDCDIKEFFSDLKIEIREYNRIKSLIVWSEK